MLISKNSQLGLNLSDTETCKRLFECMSADYELAVSMLKLVDERGYRESEDILRIPLKDDIEGIWIKQLFEQSTIRQQIVKKTENVTVTTDEGSTYFFICDSVYKAAELVKIGNAFTGRTMKDIKPGKYTYLMGKTEVIRFVSYDNVICGFYWNTDKVISFEWGVDQESGEYYYSPTRDEEFTTIMQLLIFIELGDVQIKILESGRNNGKSRKDGKITNDSKNSVFVVDSNWNTIVMRTEGFGVRGHFRLQPCGSGMADRKLIWISAFEKHGYTRRPTGEILK